jgi:type IV pilus assembly protein PilN
MRIALNLASRPFADLGPAIKRLRIAMGVLALASIGLGLGLRAFDRKAEEARARDHSLDGQIARITQERQGYQKLMAQPANAQLLEQVGMLNRLFDEKAFSWTLAMEDLETVLPGGVQVSTIEPVRAKDGHITLRLRVIGPRDRAVELVRNLEHSKRFLLPRIVGENAESSGGPGERLEPVSASNRVDFDLLAEYNPALPGERKPAKKPAPTREEFGGQPASRAAHPLGGPVFVPAPRLVQPPRPDQAPGPDRFRGPVRPPYTDPPRPKPDPALYSAPGGPQ